MKLKNSAFKLHPTANYFMCSGDGLECFLNYPDHAIVFFHPPWSIGIRYALRLALTVRKLRHREIDVIICCNEPSESKLMNSFGVTAYHLNQNMHLSEQVYRPVDGLSIAYDAIYAAQASKFKRIHLACKIERLYVLTYRCKFKDSEGRNDLYAFEPSISHCDYNKNFIYNKEDIVQLYSLSACGLALSKKEGAMWASMEYLMAGLPVVTTKNIGGRDHYFDREYTKWVAPNADAVREGVNFFLKNPPERHSIREKVMCKVKRDRQKFLEILNAHLVSHDFSEASYEYIWGGNRGILDLHQPILVPEKSQ